MRKENKKINLKDQNGKVFIIVIVIVVLLVAFAIAIVLSLRNSKRTLGKNNGVSNSDESFDYEDNTVDEKNDNKKANINEIKIGDYVEYKYDKASPYINVTEQYTGSEENNNAIEQTEDLDWVVLNVDKKAGVVDLISNNTTDRSIEFSGAIGYTNGPAIMNAICAAHYSNKALGITARNINLADIEKHLSDEALQFRNTIEGKYTPKYGNTISYTGKGSFFPKIYAGQVGAGIDSNGNLIKDIKQPNISDKVDPYKKSVIDTNIIPGNHSDFYMQNQEQNLTVTQTAYEINIVNEGYGEAAKLLERLNPYWVASRGEEAFDNFAYFGLYTADYSVRMESMFCSNTGGLLHRAFLRPVVSVKINQLEKTDRDFALEDWRIKGIE